MKSKEAGDQENTLTRRRLGSVMISGGIAASLAMMGPSSAQAYTSSVTVRWGGICSITYNVLTNAGFSGGVKFNLGSHSSRYLTLATRNSWGWARDDNGLNLPLKWNNQYHVRFLDAYGRNVWTQYNAIPNGGKRRFYVGSNVRTILVAAGPGRNEYGYLLRPVVGAGVAYIS